MTRRARILLLCLAAAVPLVLAIFLPPIPQDLAYHDFADKRPLFGIPNFGDVAGNAAFLLSGLAGLFLTWRHKPENLALWLTFFLGVFLTGFGSAFYHLAPDSPRLVWDRLPMTIAFMSLFPLLVAERVDGRAGRLLFPILLAAGVASVFYWDLTDDLRPYALVQFLPLPVMLLIVYLFPARHKATKYLLYTLGWYVAAKVLEYFDDAIFTATAQIVSGHTLKHIAAAIGTAWMIRYMRKA